MMSKRENSASWIDNIISYHNSGDPGACPFCGSHNLEVFVLDIGRKSLNFRCHSCGKFAHIDGFKTFE